MQPKDIAPRSTLEFGQSKHSPGSPRLRARFHLPCDEGRDRATFRYAAGLAQWTLSTLWAQVFIAACSFGQIPEHGVIEGGQLGSGWEAGDASSSLTDPSATDAAGDSQEATEYPEATNEASTAGEATEGHDAGHENTTDSDQTQADGSASETLPDAVTSGTTTGDETTDGSMTGETDSSTSTDDTSTGPGSDGDTDGETADDSESDEDSTDEDTGQDASGDSSDDDERPLLDPLECSLEDNLSSEWGGTRYPERIVFNNESGATRRLYWLDGNGNREFYASLKDGTSREQETRTSDVWLITDNERSCIDIFVGLPGESRAVLR